MPGAFRGGDDWRREPHRPCSERTSTLRRTSVGDPYDNAVAEAFWGRMQTELLNRQRWKTRLELANAIFEYLEIFHNRQRRHSALGMRTPIEYETLYPDTHQLACNPAS